MEPSSRSSGAIRTFTLKEANDSIPYISKMMDKVTFLNGRIKSLTADIENLVSIWGKDVLNKDHIDNGLYFDVVNEREESFKELIEKINDIQALGCIVKDSENGMVDFYHDRNGELVFLCWKYGEGKIDHWHNVGDGFSNRKNIDNLM